MIFVVDTEFGFHIRDYFSSIEQVEFALDIVKQLDPEKIQFLSVYSGKDDLMKALENWLSRT